MKNFINFVKKRIKSRLFYSLTVLVIIFFVGALTEWMLTPFFKFPWKESFATYLGAVMFVFAAAEFANHHQCHLRVKDFLSFNKRLTYSPARVTKEIEQLSTEMKKSSNLFAPNVVVGIGGNTTLDNPRFGGAIIGFYLASTKYLGTKATYLNYLRRDEHEKEETEKEKKDREEKNLKTCRAVCDYIVKCFSDNNTGKILIVDDITKSGFTLIDVREKIKSILQEKCDKHFVIRTAVLVGDKNSKYIVEDGKSLYCKHLIDCENTEAKFPWQS